MDTLMERCPVSCAQVAASIIIHAFECDVYKHFTMNVLPFFDEYLIQSQSALRDDVCLHTLFEGLNKSLSGHVFTILHPYRAFFAEIAKFIARIWANSSTKLRAQVNIALPVISSLFSTHQSRVDN